MATRSNKSVKRSRSLRSVADLPVALITVNHDGDLMRRLVTILDQARANVVRAVNSNMVIAYWLMGREIVLALQDGEDRADYGSKLLSGLSVSLTQRYGRGFSVTNLKYFRLFYQAYAKRNPEIRHKACDELPGSDQQDVWKSVV